MSLWVACDHSLGWPHIPEIVSSHFSNWNLYFNHLVQFLQATAVPLNKHLVWNTWKMTLIQFIPNLFTCHKESLTMIFPHPESQFSDKQKNSYTHLVKKYWDFRKWLPTSPWFITLFSLLPPSTLRKEYLAMLSDLPTKLLIPHTGCCYKWAYTQGIDTSQPYWSRLPGRQGGGRGNKFIISFPSSPYPISYPAITWPKRIQISHQITA